MSCGTSRVRRGFMAPVRPAVLAVLGILWAVRVPGDSIVAPGAPVPAGARALLDGGRPGTFGEVYAFLRMHPPKDVGGGPHFAALKDAVLQRLLALENPPADMSTQMCAIVADAQAEPVGRVYCAQYLGRLYPRLAQARNAEATALVRTTLTTALTDADPLLAGTALLQLGELCGEHPEIEADMVAKHALTLAASSAPTARSSGIQICAKLGETGVLDMARRAARSDSASVVRASAIHAVGVLGEAADLEWLRRDLANARNRPFAPALRAAIQRLETRFRSTRQDRSAHE